MIEFENGEIEKQSGGFDVKLDVTIVFF